MATAGRHCGNQGCRWGLDATLGWLFRWTRPHWQSPRPRL